MDLMGALDEMSRDEVICFVSQCQHESGGFRASLGHDPSLLCTLSAVQVAKILCRHLTSCPQQMSACTSLSSKTQFSLASLFFLVSQVRLGSRNFVN